ECRYGRARDPRVQDVADDRDVQALEAAELLLDRVQVEQRLSGMLVLPVAGVHDMRIRLARDEVRRTDLWMPDHDHVRVVGAERASRVLPLLALVDGGADHLHCWRG